VVSNLDEFYQAFAVSEGDKHFMPENERVRIWSRLDKWLVLASDG
jgi:putative endopeptidase